MTALEQYVLYMQDDDEPEPLEKLRFFLSLALNDQDWLDVEAFINEVEAQISGLKLALDSSFTKWGGNQ